MLLIPAFFASLAAAAAWLGEWLQAVVLAAMAALLFATMAPPLFETPKSRTELIEQLENDGFFGNIEEETEIESQ